MDKVNIVVCSVGGDSDIDKLYKWFHKTVHERPELLLSIMSTDIPRPMAKLTVNLPLHPDSIVPLRKLRAELEPVLCG